MVDLMLDDASSEILEFHDVFFSLRIEKYHLDP